MFHVATVQIVSTLSKSIFLAELTLILKIPALLTHQPATLLDMPPSGRIHPTSSWWARGCAQLFNKSSWRTTTLPSQLPHLGSSFLSSCHFIHCALHSSRLRNDVAQPYLPGQCEMNKRKSNCLLIFQEEMCKRESLKLNFTSLLKFVNTRVTYF